MSEFGSASSDTETLLAAMERAFALASNARLIASPNPWVGCVILASGHVVGEGHTGVPGEPHAEVAALIEAGDKARGATAVVTLEPCAHVGRTGKCVDALADAGIAHVIVAIRDPDPRVSGAGIEALRASGIAVELWSESSDPRRALWSERVAQQLEPYCWQRRTGLPFVILKVAMSLDGRTASADGSSQWITGTAARQEVHALRAASDAILIGSGTAMADDPSLTVRDADRPRVAPLRVLIDSAGRVAPTGNLANTEGTRTLIATTERSAAKWRLGWQSCGAAVEVFDAAPGGNVPLRELLALLGRAGCLQVLVEGGPGLSGAFMSGSHVQRLITYIAPKLLGSEAKASFDLAQVRSLSDSVNMRLVGMSAVGEDVRLELAARQSED